MSKADTLLKRATAFEGYTVSLADTLLKKASAFERLALYSDRKSFLQSLSQATTGLDDASKGLINQALSLMQQIGVSEQTFAPLSNALLFNKVDPNAIRQAFQKAQFEIPALSTGPQLGMLKQLLSQIKFPGSGSVEESSPSANIGGSPASAVSQFPAIDPKEQNDVFRIATIEGLIVPPDSKHMSDGKLGPQTRAAIKALRGAKDKTNGQPLFPELTQMSDTDVLTWAGMKAQSPRYNG
jgi:hypothetical protein